jgi:hypothetical protein
MGLSLLNTSARLTAEQVHVLLLFLRAAMLDKEI